MPSHRDRPAVLAANRLLSGAVVYMAADGQWTPAIEEALLSAPGEPHPFMDQAQASAARQEVVGVSLRPMAPRGAGPSPDLMREIIRARGPSVRPDLGPWIPGES